MPSIESAKHTLIDKANTRMVTIVSIAAFISAFCLVATKTFISQAAYQNRVIAQKREAVRQLESNIAAEEKLRDSYKAFISTSTNAIGGLPGGVSERDGDNAKIVLDALPSSYDFPALATSLDRLIVGQSVQINSIVGTDDELAQAANQSSINPQPTAIPFQLSVSSDYEGAKRVVNAFERSIRPIQLKAIDISGDSKKLTVDVKAQTYYQPAKSMKIRTEVVK